MVCRIHAGGVYHRRAWRLAWRWWVCVRWVDRGSSGDGVRDCDRGPCCRMLWYGGDTVRMRVVLMVVVAGWGLAVTLLLLLLLVVVVVVGEMCRRLVWCHCVEVDVKFFEFLIDEVKGCCYNYFMIRIRSQ